MRLASLRQIVSAAIGSARVPHLSIANNTFTLVSDAENKKVVSQIEPDGTIYVDVHIVDANSAISKIYYKEKFSNKEDEQVAPTCFSDDGIVPSSQSQEKQCDTCAQCQWNVWGTAVTDMGNKGKACRDMWKTAVVVPMFSPDALFQFRVPPASLKAWNAYVSSFAEFKFDDGTEWTVGHVITRIYFEPGKQGIVGFGAARVINEEEGNYLLRVQNENLAIALIGLGGSAPALPAPEKKEQKAIAQQTVASAVASNKMAVQDTASTTAQAAQQAIQEEEDEEAALQREMQERMAALKAKKAAAQQEAVGNVQPASTKTTLLPSSKTATTGQSAKAAMQSGFAKAGLASLAKAGAQPGAKAAKAGVVELDPGMRSAKSAKAGMIQSNVEEAELVEDEPQTVAKNSSVPGIPGANLPDGLQQMLSGIMGK